ncbi:MAG: Mov34/MPN/PAD-1 family protein [Methanomicrobia archaeon]|nr:Mov34/MPN/PAD-1 family protein [Methanomicrobia archaeon]
MRRQGKSLEIAHETLDFILEVSKSSHPQEFFGLLCAKNDLITEVIFLPGTISSEKSAVIRREMIPMGLRRVGSVHSHPSAGSLRPSGQDLRIFPRMGEYHIITCYPYEEQDWRCYSALGEERELRIRMGAAPELEEGEEELLW